MVCYNLPAVVWVHSLSKSFHSFFPLILLAASIFSGISSYGVPYPLHWSVLPALDFSACCSSGAEATVLPCSAVVLQLCTNGRFAARTLSWWQSPSTHRPQVLFLPFYSAAGGGKKRLIKIKNPHLCFSFPQVYKKRERGTVDPLCKNNLAGDVSSCRCKV